MATAGFRSLVGFWFGGLSAVPPTVQAGWRARQGFWFGGMSANPASVVVTPPDGPHGPGFHAFGPHEQDGYHPTWVRHRPEYEKLRHVLTKAEDAETRAERRLSGKELKEAVDEFVAVKENERYATLTEALKQTKDMNIALSAYVRQVSEVMALWEAENDDLLAMRIIMALI